MEGEHTLALALPALVLTLSSSNSAILKADGPRESLPMLHGSTAYHDGAPQRPHGC